MSRRRPTMPTAPPRLATRKVPRPRRILQAPSAQRRQTAASRGAARRRRRRARSKSLQCLQNSPGLYQIRHPRSQQTTRHAHLKKRQCGSFCKNAGAEAWTPPGAATGRIWKGCCTTGRQRRCHEREQRRSRRRRGPNRHQRRTHRHGPRRHMPHLHGRHRPRRRQPRQRRRPPRRRHRESRPRELECKEGQIRSGIGRKCRTTSHRVDAKRSGC
mmetsp:Transcript_67919/g.189672  ORF Transcript_67919/g.189672 Transcript_67919/m.189672 type:complete len:215 (+) Transcript_67919:753-1397(+)